MAEPQKRCMFQMPQGENISLRDLVLAWWPALLVVVIGTALDMTPTILILTPVLVPVIKEAGIDPIYFGGRRMVLADVDRISTERPVVIIHSNFHVANANTPVLAKADAIKADIIAGKIAVPDYYKLPHGK